MGGAFSSGTLAATTSRPCTQIQRGMTLIPFGQIHVAQEILTIYAVRNVIHGSTENTRLRQFAQSHAPHFLACNIARGTPPRRGHGLRPAPASPRALKSSPLADPLRNSNVADSGERRLNVRRARRGGEGKSRRHICLRHLRQKGLQ